MQNKYPAANLQHFPLSPPVVFGPICIHLCLLQPVIHLPEVLAEELLADWLPVNPDPLTYLNQVRRAVGERRVTGESQTGLNPQGPMSQPLPHTSV